MHHYYTLQDIILILRAVSKALSCVVYQCFSITKQTIRHLLSYLKETFVS